MDFLSIYHIVYFSPTCNYYNNCFIIIIIIITLQMRCELTFSNYCVLPVEVSDLCFVHKSKDAKPTTCTRVLR